MKPGILSMLACAAILFAASGSLNAQHTKYNTTPIPGESIPTDVPSGYSILGNQEVPPPGYTYTGNYVFTRGTKEAWNARADMPAARYGLVAAAINGKIYAIGGHDGSSISARNEEYDPATNTWATRADMLAARFGLAAVAMNDKIYAIGGWDTISLSAKNEEYDPATNTWLTRADMPTARSRLAVVAVNGRIYAIGGTDAGLSTKNEEYDSATNTWASRADMPTAREDLAGAVVNDRIYAIGGTMGPNITAKNEEYISPWITYYIHRKN